VYSGPAGALVAAHGQAFIEMSTTGSDVLAELQPRVAATGSTLVDAPIVGAPPALQAGRAAILVGGSAPDVERVRPVLSLFGEVRHVGPLGSGARLKLVNNSMFGAISTAAAEMQVAGELAGLDPDHVFWVLARQAPALEMRRAGYLQSQHQPTLFALRDLRKDLDLALDLFHRSDARAPVTEVVRGVVDEASEDAGDLDITAVITRYRPAEAAHRNGRR
jgi:3-hydroxyisobutyrate dehydrogenase-like beta-hydroxyacid dehydrogenase